MKDIQTLLHDYGPLLVFANVLLEQAGLPLPAYPILIVAGAMAVHGDMAWQAVLLAAVVGSLIADSAWYHGGKRYGGGLLGTVCRVSLSRDSCIRQTQSLYLRTGPAILLVAKFLPGASALSTVMSGLTRLPMRRFLAFDAAGTVLWAGSAMIIGAVFNDMLGQVLDTLGRYGGYGLGALGVVLALYLAYRVFRRRFTIAHLSHVPRVTLDELDAWRAAREDGCDVVLLDVRAGGEDPMPGAIMFDPRDPIVTQPHAWPLDARIVVYCACPDEISAAVLAAKLKKAGYRNTWALAGGYNAWLERNRRQQAANDSDAGVGAAPAA
ncbi:VTT domain-containing protein [Achromobacter aloeverae]|uniref:VTT domain-containing protein n=1 Tax=Achromobacter aloeverae TaxID=1750518 RepID=UPI001F011A56|nr:VTT domain-containing protein [Achromobacter aloeverae]